MCEQGSGRAVNRPLYESLGGELGRQCRGLSHVCRVSTLGPALFVLMAARDWRDRRGCGPCLRWMCVRRGESPPPPPPLHEKQTSEIASEPQVQAASSQGRRGLMC